MMQSDSISCPACSNRSLKFECHVDDYKYLRCPTCDLVLLANPETSSHLLDLYARDQARGDSESLNPLLNFLTSTRIGSTLFNLLRAIIYNQRAASVSTIAKTGKILDVGCGDGSFLQRIAKRGWEVSGIEVSNKLSHQARQASKGKIHVVDISASSLATSKLGQTKFDVITLWHVFEHIPNISRSLGNLTKLLAPSGQLVIEVPHSNSLSFFLFKNNWSLLLVPQHLHFWSSRALICLLSKHGLSISKIEYPIHFLFVPLSSLVKTIPVFKFIFPLLAPVSLLFSIGSSTLRQGEVIRIYARKK